MRFINKLTVKEAMGYKNIFTQENWNDLADSRRFEKFLVPEPPRIVIDILRKATEGPSFLFYLPETLRLDGDKKKSLFNLILLQRIFPNGWQQPRFSSYGEEGCVGENEPFAIETAPGWHLLLRKKLRNSVNMTMDEQLSILPKGLSLTSAIAETAKLFFFYLRSGEYLCEPVRCASVSSGGDYVNVGGFDERGLSISTSQGSEAFTYLGASGEWKLA